MRVRIDFSFATRVDGCVRRRLIGPAGQLSISLAGAAESNPPVMRLAVDLEPHSQISVGDVQKTPETVITRCTLGRRLRKFRKITQLHQPLV